MISSQQLGERIADARKRARLTQADLAKVLGVARTTVVAIEKGERPPSNDEMLRLADALKVSLHDLIRENAIRAEISPRFRMGSPERVGGIATAVERLRVLAMRYVDLEHMHGLTRIRAPLESLQTYRIGDGNPHPDPASEGAEAALAVRALLGMGDEPVVDLDLRLEAEAGLRIFYLDHLPPDLSAFLIWSDSIGGCVAINAAHPTERQRWSLAHEFGHFLRDREAGDVLHGDPQGRGEVFPQAFAREFLMPSAGVRKRFAERCRAGRFTPTDLYVLSRTQGVSFEAMARRLEELQLLPRGTYEKIRASNLRPRDLEAAASSPQRGTVRELGLPDRYVALAVSAYDEALLSESEFAKYLATDVTTARDIYIRRSSFTVDDGTRLPVNFMAADLRAS